MDMFNNALENLKKHFSEVMLGHPHQEYATPYDYALFPTGKLLRAQLVYSLGEDFQASPEGLKNYAYLASFLEFHHAYTLIHDDLPCMDDDDIRRGKPSHHRQFNEWKAILTGDGLSIASFYLLSKIHSPQLSTLIKFASWSTGPRGLILGQFLDLEDTHSKTFSEILYIHKLKTARLFQMATVGSYLLSTKKIDSQQFKKYLKMGELIGLIFQLLDDYDDLLEDKNENASQQEQTSTNLFFNYYEESYLLLQKFNEQLKKLVTSDEYPNFYPIIEHYLFRRIQNVKGIN